MNNKVELLAPAGSYQSLIAAVQNGADAVYLGGNMFNARQNASNFNDDELKTAVEYAHTRDVKVYLTLNILLNNDEIRSLTEYLTYIYSIGIDAIIVQDLGVAKFIKSVIPNMKLHASTQMTIYNLDNIKELQMLGFERVVLARELTLKEIQYICNNTLLDIEIFIHGALCISYSGQCLMSSMIGGRSGNRGLCAQPCRLVYSIEDANSSSIKKTGYLLSPKDLFSINNLEDIIQSGVKSLKIEGRMKRPEYVATVVRIYRKYIDMYYNSKRIIVDNQDIEELEQIFNRGGFTQGYFYGKTGSSMMSYEKPNNLGVYIGEVEKYDVNKKQIIFKLQKDLSVGDGIEFLQNNKGMKVDSIIKNNNKVKDAKKNDIISLNVSSKIFVGTKIYKTSSIKLLNKANESFEGENKKINIFGNVKILLNSPIELEIMDNNKNQVKVTGEIKVEKAVNRPLTRERVKEQLEKLGNTPYKFENITIEMDENVSMPISELNNLRRMAIENLTTLRINTYIPKMDVKEILRNSEKVLNIKQIYDNKNKKLSIYLNKIDKNFRLNYKVDRIYISILDYLKNKDVINNFIKLNRNSNCEIYIAMPRILRQNIIDIVKNALNELYSLIDGVLLTGIGQENIIDKTLDYAGDFSLNVFNNLSVEVLKGLGFKCVTLSPELNFSQITQMLSKLQLDTEIIVYGKLPLMISEYCPSGSIIGEMSQTKKCSNNCKNNYQLVDRLNNRLPIITDNITCQSQFLNSKTLFLGEELNKISQLNLSYIRLNFTIEDSNTINDVIKFHRDFIEKGNEVFDTYKAYINSMKKDFTRGHYFRGVD